MAPALLLVPAALASFVLAFGTGVELVRFTSLRPLLRGMPEPEGPEAHQGWLAAFQDRGVLAPLAWDLGLLLLFVGQHSLMATEAVKVWLSRYFGVLQRSLYVACTALALQEVHLVVPRAPVPCALPLCTLSGLPEALSSAVSPARLHSQEQAPDW
ncbi:nurim isoform X3 [Eptesicus fuscus]|uniref:nurim isoform X3 n=1 Tax=Eptesicus fuscus TaxID=29078 RepID=UPI0024047570|nr:nurim isoform X3 [Eptesicus fuscus]